MPSDKSCTYGVLRRYYGRRLRSLMRLTEDQLRELIREEIRKVKGGWKVYPKKPRKGRKRRKALSKKPLSYKRALAQLRAVERSKSLNENYNAYTATEIGDAVDRALDPPPLGEAHGPMGTLIQQMVEQFLRH